MSTDDTRTPLPDSWEARRAAGRQWAEAGPRVERDELERLRDENARLKRTLRRLLVHEGPWATPLVSPEVRAILDRVLKGCAP